MANKLKSNTTFFDGRKAVDLWGDDLAGWTILSGETTNTDADYYKFIPTLGRAVNLRAGEVATMPFELRKGKTVYDSSAEWKNKVGFMPNPTRLLYLIEAALSLMGKAYLFRERSAVATKTLKYHLPNNISEEIDKVKGEVRYFKRMENFVEKRYTVDDYVYFWPPDPYVELGPAINYPAQSAANACGVLMNVDLFASNFFERGAIKAMLLTVQGMPVPAEREKLESWWRNVVSGIKNAFGAKVINAESVKPVVIGEGMKELENVTVGQEKREDISIALGIPMSILFANAANYATSQQDELNFLTKTVIPECEFIASVLNEQLFDALGLKFAFLPETLDAMQEDETARAAAMNTFMDALNKAESLEMAQALFMIYGVEIPDEAMALIEKAYADKEKKAEEAEARNAERLAQLQEQQPVQNGTGQPNPPEEDDDQEMMKSELEKWKRKAVKALKRGKSANVDFVTGIIPTEMITTITDKLECAASEADISAAFEFSEPTRTDDSIVANLLEGIKMGVEALKVTE